MPGTNKSRIMPVIRVAAGNFLEMYDFMVFGYYATAIGRTFFPNSSDFAQLMNALMTFGAGYIMRPLGAIFLGAYIDQHGRRKGLLLTLSLMAVGTLSIAVMPGYATIGVIAPLLILLGRLVQGLSAGVEVGGVSVYLAEISTPGNKGFYTAFQSGSQQVAVMLAAVVGIVLNLYVSPAEMAAWGWRIPLLLGCAIVPFLFVLRRSLGETGEFLATQRHPTAPEVFRTIASNWRLVLLGTMISTMTTVCFYLITAYTPTFGGTTLKLPNSSVQLVLLCVGFSNFIWLPVMGAVSDRLGRRPLLIAFSVITLLTAYPALLWLVEAPSFTRLLLVELWLSFMFGGYNGAAMVYLFEIMPRQVRTAGFSVAFSIATAVFGGFTPAICTYFIKVTGNRAVPGLWLSFAAVLGLAATLMLGRRAPAQQPAREPVLDPARAV